MAENTPIGTATSADSTIAIAPSWNVTGSRWRSASEISRLLKKDSPKSPRSTSPTHCSADGRSTEQLSPPDPAEAGTGCVVVMRHGAQTPLAERFA